MKPKGLGTEETKTKRKYAKRISMYPLNPAEVLAAFMQIPSKKRKRRKKLSDTKR
jgi:hypothetical protein